MTDQTLTLSSAAGETTPTATTGLLTRADRVAIGLQITLALTALLVAAILGLAQALDRMGVDLYAWLPAFEQYYQGLTAHGVFNALVFTFAFSNGFMTLVMCRSLARRPNPVVLWASVALSWAGTSLAVWKIGTNEASVLFTMYAPLQAHPVYYVGVAIALVSTWATALNVGLTHLSWRRENPDAHLPLQAYTVIATYAMWMIASIPLAVEVLVFLLPWSAGWIDTVDPQFTRTLFWFSGHAIVYFWLLPAYVSWYTMVPAQTGGKLFSDPLARVVFLMFLVLSTPTGLHHQYTDPGVSQGMKAVHLVLTFGVFFPSMITAFSVVASLEYAGRRAGGRGLLGWIRHLRWDDPSFSAQVAAMIGFTFGGASGLINASYNVNLVVHNTAWVPGHFHLTVGTAVALSFMGIAYWLVPHLLGRGLWARGLGVAQGWLWLVGVLIFSRGQIDGGLEGMPRRLWTSQTPYMLDAWFTSNVMTAIGGTIMFVSILMFFVVILGTVAFGRAGEVVPMPVTESLEGPLTEWGILERWSVWVGVAVLLVVIAYAPFFATYLPLHDVSPGFKVW